MKTTTSILLSFAGVTLACAQAPASSLGGNPEVIVDHAGSDIFPESWLTAKVGAKAEVLKAEEGQRCREIVNRGLGKYPAAVLSANLKRVYGVARLEYSGVTTGGTNSKTAVYIVSSAKFSPTVIEKIFHAEFSSILLRNHPNNLDQAAWLRINPPDFRYRGSGVRAIKNKQASLGLSDDLNEEGFVNEYGKASMEEDFNSYAGRLLMGDAELWNALSRHPKVKAKADLVIAFYGRLDGHFTKEFFMSLRQRAAK